jgi:ABC-type transport system involved in multi-copper enzyme maturation permease subunit
MTFRPIALRELLVASRRPATFRIRWITATGGAAATFLYWLTHFGNPSGSQLLAWLANAAFFCSVLAGVFLTSDCLSEERREGTLGLLYLSGLGGIEVVVGKLLVNGLNALLALFALLPIMAFAWLLGGVAAGEFWRTALALINTFWVSLTMGLFTSSFHRGQREALGSAFSLIFLWVIGLGGLFILLHSSLTLPALEWFCGVSPAVSYLRAPDSLYRADPDLYWRPLLLSHACGWGFLAAASMALWQVPLAPTARSQTVPSAQPLSSTGPWPGWLRLGHRSRPLSPALLDENPLFALLMARQSGDTWIWILVVLTLLVSTCNLLLNGTGASPFGLSFFVAAGINAGFFNLLITLLLASTKALYAWHACDFFATARRQQALEAILTTPISDRALLAGIHKAQRRKFVLPFTVLAIGLTLVALLQFAMGGPRFTRVDYLGAWFYAMITLPLDLGALSWMGILLSLRDRQPEWAFAKTVGLVILLPAILFFLPSALITGSIFGYAQGKLRKPIRQLLEKNPVRPTARDSRNPLWKQRAGYGPG